MKKSKSVKEESRWKDMFGLKAKRELISDTNAFAAILIEETFHAVNMHLPDYIVHVMASHNPNIGEKIANLFLTEVELSEYYFGFRSNEEHIAGKSPTLKRMLRLRSKAFHVLYESPRKHVTVYALDDKMETDGFSRIYIDINFTEAFSFTRSEKKHLFKALRNRTKSSNGDSFEGITERDLKALAITYAWDLTMAIQSIALAEFGNAKHTKDESGFQPLVHWKDQKARKRILTYDRDSIVRLPEDQFLSYKRPYAEIGKLSSAIDMFSTKISQAIYKYEQILMPIPVCEMVDAREPMLNSRSSIDMVIREVHTWFFCNHMYDKYGDSIQDMLLSPLRLPKTIKPFLVESYEIGTNYATIYNITKMSMKARLNADRVEDFSENPLQSESMMYLNLVCVFSSELREKDREELEEYPLAPIYVWFHLWAQIMAVIYQKTGYHIEVADEPLKDVLAGRAINSEDVMSTSAQKRLILSKAKSYADDLDWKIRKGLFPNNNGDEYAAALASKFTKIN